MIRRFWQSRMIQLARDGRIKRSMQANRAASSLATRFVSGGDAVAGVKAARDLFDRNGIRSSLFYLGEYVDTPELVGENVASKLAVVDALTSAGLDVHVSVDPTQIGQALDPAMVRANAERIASAIRRTVNDTAGLHCLMFDMEDAAVVDGTIAMHDTFAAQGLPVALTLQAYLRRTSDDLARQIARGSRVRLVKGAFAAGRDIAFTGRGEIKRNYRDRVRQMLSADARRAGFYPVIATHDTALHAFAREQARSNGWSPGEYEFEMLLGVRTDVARQLAQEGERVRLYVPFGRDWWPYAVRRIGENPANAVLLARSLFG